MEEPFVYDGQVEWYLDKNLSQVGRVPLDYIRRFKWVWIICDNPPVNTPEPNIMYDRI